jgi:ABC-type branched-subunit amino acid transport system substrate-binding protein
MLVDEHKTVGGQSAALTPRRPGANGYQSSARSRDGWRRTVKYDTLSGERGWPVGGHPGIKDDIRGEGLMRLRGLLVSVVVGVLVAAGCGRSGGSSSSQKPAAPAPSVSSGDFGSLKGVCGPGTAKGATDPGVTDTTINVGTMSDPGATVAPGLNQELFDSATTFVGWCNAAGGILGRKLTLHKWDAALLQVAAKMVQACQAPDFMLVGNGEALDATGVQQRLSCKLPEIAAFDVSAAAGSAPLSLDPLPTPNAASAIGGGLRALAAFDPEAIKHFGMISINQQSIKDASNRDKAALPVLGYSLVSYQEIPLLVDNWRPYVENLKSAGVQVFELVSNPDQLAQIYKAMQDVGYFPKYAIVNTNNYDPKLIAEGGTALNGSTGGVLINSSLIPFELASQYPAVQQYVSLLQQYANAKPKSLGVNGFSAWLLFAQSVKACGSNLTRTCVMDHAQATHDWTGGGLHGTAQPSNANGDASQCFVLVKATPSGFVVDKEVTKPNSGVFNCDPANTFRLKGFPPS